MNFTTAIRTVLSKYATFTGRASRPEYWYWTLALVILSVVLSIIEGAVLAPALGFEAFAPEAGQPLTLVMVLLIIVPSLAVAIRRLHDIGRSGWWVLIQVVPLLGSLLLLWWYIQPGTEGPNGFD